jgi:hypothetical protein
MGFRLIPLDDNMKRINQLLIIFIIIILSSFLNIGSADPFLPKGAIGLEPNPPLINVQSPTENQAFEKASNIWLNFSVTTPITTWNYTGTSFSKEGEIAHTFGKINFVNYSLDENNFNITGKHMYEESGILYYSIPIEQLLEGGHTISIMAEGSGLYGELQGDVYIGSGYSMNTLPSKTVSSVAEINFMVDYVNTTPFNTLTSPPYLLPLTVVILVVTILFLVYRRHRKPISQNKPND